MKKLLETLYVTTPESYLFERNGNICISIGGAEKAAVPISQVDSIVLFGKNTLSTALMAFCSKNDVAITFLSENGNFLGQVCGPVSGNVLLRKRQYESLTDPAFVNRFVGDLLFCKIRNSKSVLIRHARSTTDEATRRSVTAAAAALTDIAKRLDDCADVDSMRGVEGAAASVYFSCFDELLSSPKGYRFETRSRRPPLNEVNAMLSEIDDISEKLKIALRDATDDKAKLDYILDNVSDGIVALDSEDNVSLINRNATRIFPVGAEGKRYTVLSADPDFNKAVSETLKTGKDGHFEFSEDGKIYLVNVKPLDNGYTVIVLSDVTAMKTGERMRSEFFANASHELKTPLTAVKAFNDMIALEPSGDKVKEFSQKIDKEVSRIISLINDMLDLSKLESGRPLSPVTVDLAATAREVAESLAPLANEKKVSVSVSGEGKAVLEREHAVELLKNLTENGIRYNNAGGHVSVIIAEEDDSVSMTVKDDGIGIEEEHLGRICERFYRVNKSRSRETGGTGLGLSIVKHICEIYGADLSITSKIGVGTDIMIVFHNSALPAVSAVSE